MAQIKLQKVRLAFPQLFTPKAINGGSSRYSAALIIDPKSANAKAIEKAMIDAATAKWGDKGATVLAKLKQDKRVCYRTEERTNKEGEVYEGFEGMHSLNASNKVRPLVIDADKSPLSESDGRPYAGCYVNAMVEVWAQNNPDPTIGRRINCTLLGIQFAGDGDSFGGTSVASVDSFETVDASAIEDLA